MRVGLVYFKTTTSGLSYELGVNGEKEVNANWDINKNGHHFVYVGLWSNNQVISKFYYLLIFSPCFN